jgi:hypothetical protein
MKKRLMDDSAKEPDVLKELDDVKGTPTEDKIVEFIEKTKEIEKVNVIEKVSKIEEITKNDIFSDKPNNKLLTQWQNRQKKDIPPYPYTDVVLLVETPFCDCEDSWKEKKIPAGQVGRVVGALKTGYFISFSNHPSISDELMEIEDYMDEPDERVVLISVSRNELLVLDNNASFEDEEVQLLKFDVNKDLKKEISLSETQIKIILKEELKYVNKNLPSPYKNNLKPGKLVTIITDFMVETKYEYIVKIHAGQIGVILDPSTDKFTTDEFTTKKKQSENKFSEINQNPSSKLGEDEVLVYFSAIPLWNLFPICSEDYKGIAPFECDQCYILNKAFLLPLCFELSEDEIN